VLDFYQKATGCTLPEAIAALASGASNQQVLPMEPPKEKLLAVTDVQRGFERSALDGFKESIENDDSVLCRLLAAKGIGKHVAMSLWSEGSLGAIDGKPVYLNNFGSKIRHEAETSRSSRWLCGGSCNYVWRHRLLLSPWIQRVVITESETDAMKLMSLIPQGLRCVIVAAPSASWNPIQDMSFAIGAHREVLIWMDQDKAGRAASAKLVEVFKDVSNCKVATAMTSDDDKKDVCEMKNERIVEVYNETCKQFSK
jgi:5S rRNA maturation endonuclease (ribonuclease M5)